MKYISLGRLKIASQRMRVAAVVMQQRMVTSDSTEGLGRSNQRMRIEVEDLKSEVEIL